MTISRPAAAEAASVPLDPLPLDSVLADPAEDQPSTDSTSEPTSEAGADSTSELPTVDAPDGQAAAGPFDAVPAQLRGPLIERGFDALTEVQAAVLEPGLAGRDLQVFSRTGSGKTVALGFVLSGVLEAPGQDVGPRALIIVPTRELAKQVSEELRWLLAGLDGVQVGAVTGGHPMHKDRALFSRGPRVLVGTPGRLLDHVRGGSLDLSDVAELVLDEADQMLDMGFREELEGILEATSPERRTHLVSATFPEGIRRLAATYQQDPVALEATRLGEANADIEHAGHLVPFREQYAALVNLLLMAGGERTLVFVERRAEAVELASRLESDGFAALPLSGELAQNQRERTLAAFRSGHATVLVATDVAARGIDVPDVSTVIHTSPPMDPEGYTHRSGRTGRAGKRGRSVLLTAPNRRRRVQNLLASAGIELSWSPIPDEEVVRAELARRAQAQLREQLTAAREVQPESRHEELARELLQEGDPVQLVAALLGGLEPRVEIEPRQVAGSAELEAPRHKDRGNTGRERREGRPRQKGGDRPPSAGSVRFFMNFGRNQGASPARLLAAICRRGQVEGSQVGSIAIHPNASTFDIQEEVAEEFERLASRRDSRDPRTIIRRDRGPRQKR